jgi:hypothetical protein
MSVNTTARGAFSAVRRHPARAAAVCAPLLAAGILYGATMASASPIPTLAVSAAALRAAPAPHVLLFGNDRSAPAPAPAARPSAPALGWHVTGCDADYGTAGQCVPWTIPGSTSQSKCAWLRSNGFGPLRVVGTNRQDLAENARGYVCAPGR